MGEFMDPNELAFVNRWLRQQGIPDLDVNYVDPYGNLRVMFRKLGQPGDTAHVKNHYATALTRWPWEKPPFGNSCHAEVLVSVRHGVTLRLGTVYKNVTKDPLTKKQILIPGSVFIKVIDDCEFYDTLKFQSTRAAQVHVLRCAILNLGCPFNNRAYFMKAISPWATGVGSYDPEAHADPRAGVHPLGETHCTQFVVILLQAAAHTDLKTCGRLPKGYWSPLIMTKHAPSEHPNSMFRVFYYAEGVEYQSAIRPRDVKLGFDI